MKSERLKLFLLLAITMTAQVFAARQTAAAQTAPQQAMASPKATVVTMTECEGVNNCATWSFLGTQGNGKWPSGEEGNLTVEHFDADSVVIRRSDSTGNSAGYTAVYTGKRHGNNVGGEFTASWPGHENTTGNWYATIETNAKGLPRMMWHCTVNHTTLVWTWNGEHYTASDGDTGASMPGMALNVIRFTPQSVVLRRIQTGATADLDGRISSEGNSIEGNGVWHSQGNTWSGPFKMFWGTAKPADCSAPPQSAQQSVIVVRPVVACIPWFFGVICN